MNNVAVEHFRGEKQVQDPEVSKALRDMTRFKAARFSASQPGIFGYLSMAEKGKKDLPSH